MPAQSYAAPPAAEGLLFPAPRPAGPAATATPAAPAAPATRQQALSALEQRYPGLWRAGQLGRAGSAAVCPTGYDALSAELPGGGWPAGGLTELLSTQGGAGELRLLLPALRALAGAGRRIALVAPPCLPNAMGLAAAGLPARQLYWLRPPAGAAKAAQADMLWAAEQVLRSQAFGGVLVWLPAARAEALRRLQVLAQAGDAVVWALRPAAALRESSPAVLRLLLAPQPGNVLSITFHKRRGPVRDTPLLLRLGGMEAATRTAAWPLPAGAPAGARSVVSPVVSSSSQSSPDAVLDRGAPAATAPGRTAAQLA
ncbi:translesion DNA synthesis-associated protein ImuA [Cupriavidus sp. amp6]|uniref:translesion DNA synthesis-associated protein ImuA n=1 Tax=Cupriavidus sp. amp6 TaxID=388051 RepID=UPI0003F754C6|nr:translesion DNA synthesis-associated protein ImuA [Cupriavidus sp. amp6]